MTVKDILLIPKGAYCHSEVKRLKYGEDGVLKLRYKVCPYWSKNINKAAQQDGYCSYLGTGDWENEEGLLWDQVKECGVNTRGINPYSDAIDTTRALLDEDNPITKVLDNIGIILIMLCFAGYAFYTLWAN